jgi:alkylation response protein AidB-like acyl-CoA dehydrogenase
MTTYHPPLADMDFVLHHVLQAEQAWADMPDFADMDAQTANAVLEQAGVFASEVLAPINASGDAQGCHWSPDGVRAPDGFAHAYQAFVANGWPALACAPEHGGQGLPNVINAAVYEMLAAANHGWTMYPGLLHGAYETLAAHGTAELKALYLAQLTSGEWLATMALTEPQAGSDLGLVRTRGEVVNGAPAVNGAPVRITGSKIFISGGDHDLTDNIVHLVLFRLPDAAAGTKGISLALVPKWLPDGSRNGAYADGIEHKMGIHGSATCQMRFENATGWIVGQPHQGLRAMFLMMNAARLHVAMQGLGHLEAATQGAWAYARERVQMRAPQRPEGATPAPADPIAWHPAMRRILWTLRARTDAARVFAYWLGVRLDQAHHHPDEAERATALADVALLTPVAKAFLTDLGHTSADQALQVWGGYGYVREYGIEQTVRDSRIAMIYEGTNEIQAIDLVQRKLLADGGAHAQHLAKRIARTAQVASEQGHTVGFGHALRAQLQQWQEANTALLNGAQRDAAWPLELADDYLRATGHLMMAWSWAQVAIACQAPTAQPQTGARDKTHWLMSAQFGVDWLLAEAQPHWARLLAAARPLPMV